MVTVQRVIMVKAQRLAFLTAHSSLPVVGHGNQDTVQSQQSDADSIARVHANITVIVADCTCPAMPDSRQNGTHNQTPASKQELFRLEFHDGSEAWVSAEQLDSLLPALTPEDSCPDVTVCTAPAAPGLIHAGPHLQGAGATAGMHHRLLLHHVCLPGCTWWCRRSVSWHHPCLHAVSPPACCSEYYS